MSLELPGVPLAAELNLDAFGTLRARAGVPMDRLIPFVAGGVAWARGSLNNILLPEQHDDHVGFVVGAGLEYAVSEHVTIKAEYLYADFGEAEYPVGASIDLSAHFVRAGINFKF